MDMSQHFDTPKTVKPEDVKPGMKVRYGAWRGGKVFEVDSIISADKVCLAFYVKGFKRYGGTGTIGLITHA
jgi:hypothetical protein